MKSVPTFYPSFCPSPSSLWALGHGAGAPAVSLSFPDSLQVWKVVSEANAQSRLGWEGEATADPLCGEQMVNGAPLQLHPGQASGT